MLIWKKLRLLFFVVFLSIVKHVFLFFEKFFILSMDGKNAASFLSWPSDMITVRVQKPCPRLVHASTARNIIKTYIGGEKNETG